MPLQPNDKAPYTTGLAAITALDAFRDRGLGIPITADILTRAGVPESISRRTLHSLVLLELIDADGQPSPTFEAFRQARGDEEYRALLQEWLRGVYADVLQYGDPSTDPLDRVQEAFRTYQPAGQRVAMASLLVVLWRYAGLPVAGAENVDPRRQVPHKAKPRKAKPSPPKEGWGKPVSSRLMLPPGLLGVLEDIPPQGESWTTERRNSFLRLFEVALNHYVTINDEVSEDSDQEVE